jgi:CHAT domain-containing protein/tetratricopeptide (TPR) repeat protein
MKQFFVLILLFTLQLSFSQSFEKAWEPIQKRIDKGESFTDEELNAFSKKYAKDLEKNLVEKSIIVDFLGTNAFHQERYQDAVDLFNKAIEITKINKDTLYTAFYIYDLACLYSHIGYFPDAEPLFIKSLPVLAAVYGQSSLQYTMRFKVLAEMYIEMGNYAYAKSMNDALLYYFKTLNGEKDQQYLLALNNDARIDQGTGEYEKSVVIFKKLLEIHESIKPMDTTGYITIENNLAESYRTMGNYDDAIKMLNKALSLTANFSHPEQLSTATLYNNLGLCYKNTGDYQQAEVCFDKCIAIYKKLKLEYSPDYTNSLSNKADLYRILGRGKQAFDLLLIVLDTRKNSLGTKHVNYANALINMSLVYIDEYSYDKAEPLIKEAKEIYKEKLGENHPNYANCLNTLAGIYVSQKKYKEAEELKLQAIEIMKNTVGEEHERYAYYLGGMMNIYIAQGKYEKAIANVERSNAILKKKFGEKHQSYIDGLFNLAYLNFLMKQYKKAKELYLISLQNYKEQFDKFFESMSENDQIGFYTIMAERVEGFNSFVIEYTKALPKENHNELLASCFDNQLFIKSLLLNRSINTRKEILSSKDTSLVNLYHRWQNLKEIIAGNFRDLDLQGSYWNIAELEQQAGQMEQSLKAKTNLFASDKIITYKDIQKKMLPGEAAITILREELKETDTSSALYYIALIAKKDAPYPILVKLPDSKLFETDFSEYYSEQIENRKEDKLSYNRFWKPIATQLNGIHKIYISADGIYNQVNLYTLQDPLTNKYVIDNLNIAVLPNLSYILNQEKSNPVKSAELFGFPDYEYDFSKHKSEPKKDQVLAMNRFGFSELPPLPGTKTEVENISGSLSSNQWNVNVFTKEAASEQQLKKVVSPKVLHIATHGFFLKYIDDEEEKSYLGFEANKLRQNPLLRSGIMMAGASVVARDTLNQNKEQDGIFTAYEASLLDLSNTDLVVLSACETGLGVDMNNQGVFGLQRAFYIAGAKNLIMSLWVVDDDATQILMSEFYKEWALAPAKENISKAFKKAQAEVRKKYSHPYFWGAFTLLGN